MPTLFLHAGAPKTGTSYLQFLFAKHADKLARAGVLYPRGDMFNEAKAGRVTSGNGLEMANYICPSLPHDFGDKLAFRETFDTTLRSAGGKHVLYSSEFLFFQPNERTRTLAAIADERGYDVDVVYLVRDLKPAAISLYSQRIKRHHETRSFAEFLAVWEPYYKQSLEAAAQSFPDATLRIYNYDEHADRLAEFFFRDVLNLEYFPRERKIINRSLTYFECELIRAAALAHPERPSLADQAGSALALLAPQGAPFAITKQEADSLRARWEETLAHVNGLIKGRPIIVSDDGIAARDAVYFSPAELAAWLTRLMPPQAQEPRLANWRRRFSRGRARQMVFRAWRLLRTAYRAVSDRR